VSLQGGRLDRSPPSMRNPHRDRLPPALAAVPWTDAGMVWVRRDRPPITGLRGSIASLWVTPTARVARIRWSGRRANGRQFLPSHVQKDTLPLLSVKKTILHCWYNGTADWQTKRPKRRMSKPHPCSRLHILRFCNEDLCQRLVGQRLPSVRLSSTAGGIVDLPAPSTGRTVIYCYPRTSKPGKPAPTDWDLIPGARGCTPQACTFRDHYQELRALGAEAFGLSTQTTAYQAEMSSRLHLPFAVLSDAGMRFTNAPRLPTFTVDGMRLIKRPTFARGPGIETVFYPIVRPEENASDVIAWLKANPI
jgi:peroxiredoxin